MAQFEQCSVTRRQQEVLDAISRLTKARGGTGPSYKEVAIELGVTYGAVVVMAERLISRGWLRRLPRSARTLEVIKEGQSAS